MREAAQELVRARYLLDEDVDLVIENCSTRYDEALRVGVANPPESVRA